MELEVVDDGFAVDITVASLSAAGTVLEVVDGGFAVDIAIPNIPTVAGVALAMFPGPPGPVGPVGPVGPAGPAATTTGFEHAQVTPAATWTVTHTLGRYPLSCEITVGGELVFSDVDYPDVFTVVVTFASPQAGILRLT